MHKLANTLAAAVVCATLAPRLARADVPINAPSEPRDGDGAQPGRAELAAHSGMGLMNTMPASIDPAQRALAIGLGGYDSSSGNGVARLVADVHVFGPLDLRAGLTYLSEVDAGQHQWEPQLGLRLRILQQDQHGIDLATALFYRRDRYASDEGMVQLNVAAGRRFGAFGVLANLAYGQDPEGDDRDGDAALALLYEARSNLQLGIESHIRFDLASDDPRRQLRKQGPLDLQAGPFIHYAVGPALLVAEAGVSAYRFEHTQAGVYALGGVGGVL